MGGGVHKSLGNVGNSGQLTTGWYPVFVPRKLHVTYADGLFPTLQQNHQLWPVVNNKGEGTRSQPAVGSQAGFDQPQTLGEGGGASWSGEAGTAPPPSGACLVISQKLQKMAFSGFFRKCLGQVPRNFLAMYPHPWRGGVGSGCLGCTSKLHSKARGLATGGGGSAQQGMYFLCGSIPIHFRKHTCLLPEIFRHGESIWRRIRQLFCVQTPWWATGEDLMRVDMGSQMDSERFTKSRIPKIITTAVGS